jgi:hypothetical protein
MEPRRTETRSLGGVSETTKEGFSSPLEESILDPRLKRREVA